MSLTYTSFRVIVYVSGWLARSVTFPDLAYPGIEIDDEQVVNVTTSPYSPAQRELRITLSGVIIFNYFYPRPRIPFLCTSSDDTSSSDSHPSDVSMGDAEEMSDVFLSDEEDIDVEMEDPEGGLLISGKLLINSLLGLNFPNILSPHLIKSVYN